MRENFKEIPLLQQREIEAKVMGPLIRAFCREFGEERTYEIVRRTLKEVSREAGRELSERCGGGLDSLRKTASHAGARAALRNRPLKRTARTAAALTSPTAPSPKFTGSSVTEILGPSSPASATRPFSTASTRILSSSAARR